MKYRAEIDGLRALAVIPVILFHAGFQLFSGGFVGVDVFFVISGYLITTILIEDIENKRFSLIHFYERRARRILPALFFIMLACIPFAWFWMMPSQIKDFSQSLIAVSFFASNFLFERESGYFEAPAEEKPLLHTWSLAVEEQYYLLFPLFLLFIWRFNKDKVFWIFVAFSSISLALSEWGWRNDPEINFYLLPTRIWELFAGSLASLIIQRRGVQANNLLSLIGLIAIAFAIFAYDETTPFPSIYALIPVLGVVLIILYAGKETWVAKLFSTKLFVGVGLISYSAYLWHQPLFAFARIKLIQQPSIALMGSLSLLSLLLAVASWKYIEKPFRKKSQNTISRKAIFSLSLLAIVFMSSLGYIGHIQDGFRSRFDIIFKSYVDHDQFHKYVDENYVDCEPKIIAKKALKKGNFLRCKQSRKGNADWVILGDSHAEQLFIGIAENNLDKNVVFYILGAKPYISEPVFSDIFRIVKESKNKKTIFLTMYYQRKLNKKNDLYDGFSKTIKFLQNAGHEVVLLSDIPNYHVTPENCLYGDSIKQAKAFCSIFKNDFLKQKAIYEATLIRIAKENNIKYITTYPPLCDENTCSMTSGEHILYRDSDHLNIRGSRLVGKHISDALN